MLRIGAKLINAEKTGAFGGGRRKEEGEREGKGREDRDLMDD